MIRYNSKSLKKAIFLNINGSVFEHNDELHLAGPTLAGLKQTQFKSARLKHTRFKVMGFKGAGGTLGSS